MPGEQAADLSFLDFHVVPPISAQGAPLKKLEFREVAPPQRAVSPHDFVRKSPGRVSEKKEK